MKSMKARAFSGYGAQTETPQSPRSEISAMA